LAERLHGGAGAEALHGANEGLQRISGAAGFCSKDSGLDQTSPGATLQLERCLGSGLCGDDAQDGQVGDSLSPVSVGGFDKATQQLSAFEEPSRGIQN